MVSLCFKSLTNKTIINLEYLLETSNIKNIIYSKRKFKNYYNFIIHFKERNNNIFYKNIANLFTIFIINNYEKKIIKSQLRFDFFYFSSSEQEDLFGTINKKLSQKELFDKKYKILNNIIYSYIILNKKIYVDGFINFRINEYKNYLNMLLEKEIHEYIVKKEYSQYVDLLQSYITEKIENNESRVDLIHLFYYNSQKIIFDKNYNMITTTFDKKYLSDISFSENDFILNTLLSLIPQKIIIHTNNANDNFIIFLQTIFKNKFELCENCEFCNNIKTNIIKKTINTIK